MTRTGTSFLFSIHQRIRGSRARAGIIKTLHGEIQTPAFITVGTKATVKSLTPEQIADTGAQAVLANTYHLYLEPGEVIIKQAGYLQNFMNWKKPTMTDSGGFQVFSLGEAFGSGVTKVATGDVRECPTTGHGKLAKIDDEGVTFKSHLDGSAHRFTPERSVQIQHDIGADIIFAFDECTSPLAPKEYQKEALDRTHAWAKRSLDEHKRLGGSQALFGVVQGGRFEDLRKESARVLGAMDFDGFGIGGSFNKEDMYGVVGWVNDILPEDKPKHMLGIGEPEDLFGGIENGCDLFDCVAPTRLARNATLYTKDGKVNMMNTQYRKDFSPVVSACACYTCKNYSRAYLAHLFRSKEILANTLASIHNVHFIVTLVAQIRENIIQDTFDIFKRNFLSRYLQGKS